MFGFHNPCWACTVWSSLDSDSYHYWNSQTHGDNFLSSIFEELLRNFHLAFLKTVPPNRTVSVFQSRINFLISISFRVLTIRSRLEQNLPIICTIARYFSGSRRLLRDNLQCLGDLVLCQLPIAKLCSFLLTYAWCHCQSFQNTLVLIVTFAVVGCLPSCRTSRRNIDKHLRPSMFCFVSGRLLARWGVWRRTWVGQLALSLPSWVDHSPSNQLSSSVCWDFCWPSLVIVFWSTRLNRRFVAVRVTAVVVVRVGGPNVAAAQESQRNRYITAWFSSFTPAWLFNGFDWLTISQK